MRLFRELRPHLGRLAIAGALLLVGGSMPGLAVWTLSTSLDRVLQSADSAGLAAGAAAFAALFALQAAIDIVRAWITKGVAFQVCSGLRRQLFARYLAASRDGADPTGSRLAALFTEVDDVQYGVSALVTAVRNPLQVGGLAISAVALAPKLALGALVLLPAVVLPALWGGARLRTSTRQARQARADLMQEAEDALLGAQVLRALAVEGVARDRFAQVDEADRSQRLTQEVDRVLPASATQLLAGVAIAALVVLGGGEVLSGELRSGELVGFAVAIGLLNKPLSALSEVWTLWQRSSGSLERVYRELDAPQSFRDGGGEPAPTPSVGLQDVSVDIDGRRVLDRVTLDVPAGRFVALVGPTGGGKSTLLSLIVRLREPTEGRVTFGGTDVRKLRVDALRRRVGWADQESFLFARSVRDNLTLGRLGISDDALWAALRDAEVDGVVRERGGGGALDASLAELGRSLSGGERQRLCLARALVGGGDVLLLDEATNQVDPRTRAALLRVLDRLRGHRTVLMVTHDLQVARTADLVAVLDRGRVVETGPPEVLLAGDTAFRRLFGDDGGGDGAR